MANNEALERIRNLSKLRKSVEEQKEEELVEEELDARLEEEEFVDVDAEVSGVNPDDAEILDEFEEDALADNVIEAEPSVEETPVAEPAVKTTKKGPKVPSSLAQKFKKPEVKPEEEVQVEKPVVLVAGRFIRHETLMKAFLQQFEGASPEEKENIRGIIDAFEEYISGLMPTNGFELFGGSFKLVNVKEAVRDVPMPALKGMTVKSNAHKETRFSMKHGYVKTHCKRLPNGELVEGKFHTNEKGELIFEEAPNNEE